MTPEQARALFNEHREPGDLAHYGEKAAVAAILDVTDKAELSTAAYLLEQYAKFIRNDVKADDLERHPYLPLIEQTIADLRVFSDPDDA